jgi:hypothetical protein
MSFSGITQSVHQKLLNFVNDGNKEVQWRAFLKRSLLADCNLSFSQVVMMIQQKLWPIVSKLN